MTPYKVRITVVFKDLKKAPIIQETTDVYSSLIYHAGIVGFHFENKQTIFNLDEISSLNKEVISWITEKNG